MVQLREVRSYGTVGRTLRRKSVYFTRRQRWEAVVILGPNGSTKRSDFAAHLRLPLSIGTLLCLGKCSLQDDGQR